MKYSDFKLLTPIEYEEMLTPNIPFNLYYVSKILEATKSPHHKFYLTNIKENPKSIKASEYEIPAPSLRTEQVEYDSGVGTLPVSKIETTLSITFLCCNVILILFFL